MPSKSVKICPACKLPAIKGRKEQLSPEDEHALRRQLSDSKAQLKDVLDQRHANKEFEAFVVEATARAKVSKVPEWSHKPRTTGGHPSVLLSVLSDIHFEEVVDPEVMNFSNGYTPEISKERIKNYFVNVVRQAFDNLKGFKFEGLVMPWMGDFVTGIIHEELRESNEYGPMRAVVELIPHLIAGVKLVADEFGKVHIPCVIGNHGRLHHKMPSKYPVNSSFDWLIYQSVAREFVNDSRVTFDIPNSIDTHFQIYGHKFAIEHGNRFKASGNAISGVFPSVMLGGYRYRNVQQALGRPIDYIIIADKHQLRWIGNTWINGSVIGYSEWARDCKFGYEKPEQLFCVIDPEHGPTVRGSIFVQSQNEPWIIERDKKRRKQ